MKVYEIISESRLNEGMAGEAPVGIFLKARYQLGRLFGEDLATFLEKKAGKDNGAANFIGAELRSKYEKGGVLGIGAKLDREAFTKLNAAAEKYADELFDARINKFTEPKPVEAIVPPKQAATPGTPAKGPTQEPILNNNGQPIIGADGKPAMKSVPGTPATPGTAEVPNDLFAQFPDARKDILQLAEAKYLDRIASEFGTTDAKKVAEKAAEAKADKGKKDDKPEDKTDKPKKATGAKIYTVWKWSLLVAALYEILVQINQVIMRPYADYLFNVRRAKTEYVDKNIRPPGNIDVNSDGTIMSLDEWFDTYNRTQFLEAVKKSTQIEASTALTLNVGSKVANQVVPDWLKQLSSGLFAVGAWGALGLFFKGLRKLEYNIIGVNVVVGLYIANKFAEHFSNELQGGQANDVFNTIIMSSAIQNGIVSLADLNKAGIKNYPGRMEFINNMIDYLNDTYRDVNNNPEIIKNNQGVLGAIDAMLPTNLSGKRADQPGANAATNTPGTVVTPKTQTNSDGTVSANTVNSDGTPVAPATTNPSGYDNMIPNNESVARSRWIRNYDSTKVKNPRTGLWESYKR